MSKKNIIKRLKNLYFVTQVKRKYIIRNNTDNRLVGVIKFYGDYPHLTFSNGSLEVLFAKWGCSIPEIQSSSDELF